MVCVLQFTKKEKKIVRKITVVQHEATYQGRQFVHQTGYWEKDGEILLLHAAKFQAYRCVSAMVAKQLYISSFYNAP